MYRMVRVCRQLKKVRIDWVGYNEVTTASSVILDTRLCSLTKGTTEFRIFLTKCIDLPTVFRYLFIYLILVLGSFLVLSALKFEGKVHFCAHTYTHGLCTHLCTHTHILMFATDLAYEYKVDAVVQTHK